MSLEQALAANTAALQALTAALSTNVPQPLGAPSIAAVAPVPTAPVASTDSSPAPTTAFAPPVPTPPSAVAPAVPPTVPPASSGERDSKGMPWDGRIHSASKAKVADGSWRYKRGSDDAVVAQVEAELRAALGAPAATGGPAFAPHPFYEQPVGPVAAAVPAVPAAPAPAEPAAVAAPAPVAPVAVPLPPPAPVTAPTAVPPAPVASGITSYDALMAALPPKIVSGELTATQMQQACEQYGVPSIAALSARPDLVPFIAAALRL